MSNDRLTGTVVWFDNKLGYGFIKQDVGKDIFVHWSDITSEGYKSLKKDQSVIYSLGVNKHGNPKAVDVVIIEK